MYFRLGWIIDKSQMVKSIILEPVLDHVGMLCHVATNSFGAFQVGSNRSGNDFIERQDGRSQCFF